jgi:membrane-associated phospholipid phosphatase
MNWHRLFRLAAWRGVLLLPLLLLAAGCGTMSNGRAWGQDATVRPGWARIRTSAARAALDPQTWGPLVAAALLQVDDADHRISDWAVDHTPIFDSPEDAEDARHWTGTALDATFYVSLAATPSGDEPGTWMANKVRGGLVEFAGAGLADLWVDPLKKRTGRKRPNEENDKSFPSSHATRSAIDVTLAVRNIDAMDLPDPARVGLKTGVYSLGAISAWCRVEAAGHYPSDVLAGWALGHFWTAFIHDAFLYGEEPPFTVQVLPEPDGVQGRLVWSF